jgi:ammonium transporter, Amt family
MASEISSSTIVAEFSSGDTAWVLVSCALILMMILPGVAMFYAGMVRLKNVLTTLMQTLTITCVVTVLWLILGYSLAFSPVDIINYPPKYLVYGGFSRVWLIGMSMNVDGEGLYTDDYGTSHYLAPNIPEPVFVVFQLMFAIITATLIIGSIVDRMRYIPMIIFIISWHLIVYCPIAHANFHQDGFLKRWGALDFAGGNVVHISAGISGLIAAVVLGTRQGFGKEKFDLYNIVLTFIGMSLLWVGWFGFNAGSAVAANFDAGYALLNTQIAASVSGLTWMITEWIVTQKPGLIGMMNGVIAGLVSITPACGYVDQTGGFVIGLISGPICFFSAKLKHSLGYDDALDSFGVHGVGGIVGGLATGFFANPRICGHYGVFYSGVSIGGMQFAVQLVAILLTATWAGLATYCILKLIEIAIGLRVSKEAEVLGLDRTLHGETLIIEPSFMLMEKKEVAVEEKSMHEPPLQLAPLNPPDVL